MGYRGSGAEEQWGIEAVVQGSSGEEWPFDSEAVRQGGRGAGGQEGRGAGSQGGRRAGGYGIFADEHSWQYAVGPLGSDDRKELGQSDGEAQG